MTPCHYCCTEANGSEGKEALKFSGRRRQDDMYVKDFSSMYNDECSESTVKGYIYVYMYIYINNNVLTYVYIYIYIHVRALCNGRETRARNLLHDPLAIIGGPSRLRRDLWCVGKLAFPRNERRNRDSTNCSKSFTAA